MRTPYNDQIFQGHKANQVAADAALTLAEAAEVTAQADYDAKNTTLITAIATTANARQADQVALAAIIDYVTNADPFVQEDALVLLNALSATKSALHAAMDAQTIAQNARDISATALSDASAATIAGGVSLNNAITEFEFYEDSLRVTS